MAVTTQPLQILLVPRRWDDLNELLKESDLAGSMHLLEAERQGENRPSFLRRIHSRINKLRAAEERELLAADLQLKLEFEAAE